MNTFIFCAFIWFLSGLVCSITVVFVERIEVTIKILLNTIAVSLFFGPLLVVPLFIEAYETFIKKYGDVVIFRRKNK